MFYSSNPEYAKRKGYKIVTPSPKNKGETNTIISDGQDSVLLRLSLTQELVLMGLVLATFFLF